MGRVPDRARRRSLPEDRAVLDLDGQPDEAPRRRAGGGRGEQARSLRDGLELDEERFPHDAESRYIRAIDEVVASEAAGHIRAEGPDLTWIYIQYSDDVGHDHGDGPELEEAVRFMDRQVGVVWDAILDRRARHAEDWLLVVTTDHGRDQATGKDHGGQSDRERTIWIATNSGRLGPRFDDVPGIVDIMPSILDHLGLSIPEAVESRLDGASFLRPRR